MRRARFKVGAAVVDCRTHDRATVVSRARVPEMRDLLGDVIAEHSRYVVIFDDGTYAEDRTDADLAEVPQD